MRKLILSLMLCTVASLVYGQQSFSCSYGKRGACLDYSDKIVDQRAVCFSEMTCGFGGFVCKSKLDDMAAEYDTLVSSYNEMLRKHKGLAESGQGLLDQNSKLVENYNELLMKYKKLVSEYDERIDELRVLTSNYNKVVSAQRSSSNKCNELSAKKTK